MRQPEFLPEMHNVRLDGFGRQVRRLRNAPRRLASGEQRQYLLLTRGKGGLAMESRENLGEIK
jgi:hypothetical protein